MDDQSYRLFQAVFSTFGILGVASLAGGFVAYWVFRYLGQKWLDNHFAASLERLKHEQQKQIERLRLRGGSLLDRATKLHAQEFAALPGTWLHLVEAFYETLGCVAVVQRFINVRFWSDEKMKLYMERSDFLEEQIERVLNADDKQIAIIKEFEWKNWGKAEELRVEFVRFLYINGIFIRPEIRSKFEEMHDLIRFALVEHQRTLEFQNLDHSRDAIMKFQERGQTMLKELEVIVRDRLADELSLTPAQLDS